MAGLVPAIHAGGRDKPGHDSSETQVFLSRGSPRKMTLYMFHVKQANVPDEI